MSTSSLRGPGLALAAAVAILLVAGVVPALAHAEFVSSDPANGSSVATAPTTVTLTFSEGLDAGKSAFQLTQNGTSVATGKAAADGDTTMTATGLALAPGSYLIRWTSVADDGDLLRGTVTFTVLQPSAAPSTAAPSAASSPTPTAAVSSAAPPTPSPQPSADAAPAASSGNDVLLPIVLGLLIIAGVGAFLLRRTRRP